MPSSYSEIVDLATADKEEILREMERLVASKHFRASRRYPAFLRFILQHALDGNLDLLKERTLGVEIFGRNSSYDTSGDSIVRVTAAEIRKRIALYNLEEGGKQTIQIDLPFGSYVPHFRRLSADAPSPEQSAEAASLPVEFEPEIVAQLPASTPVPVYHPEPALKKARPLAPWVKLIGVSSLLLLIALAAILGVRGTWWRHKNGNILAPLWTSPHDAIICVGSPQIAFVRSGNNDQTQVPFGPYATNNTLLPFADTLTVSRLQLLLNSNHKPYQVELAREATLNTLRGGPTILIGAFDNPWTLRLTANLRFRFVGTEQLTVGEIIDTRPGLKTTGENAPPGNHYRMSESMDFAIVAITQDPALDQPLIVAAGLGPNGTMAAGEFLSNPANLDTLSRLAPANWPGKNVEVILSTQVIHGNSGPPQVVSAEYW